MFIGQRTEIHLDFIVRTKTELVLVRLVEKGINTNKLEESNYTWGASEVVLVVKNPSANARHARDMGLIPGSGRSRGVGNSNLFQYSCLENSMGRGVWWATVHGAAKSQLKLNIPAELSLWLRKTNS